MRSAQILTLMVLGDSLSMVRTVDPHDEGPIVRDSDLAVPLNQTYPVLLHCALSQQRSQVVYTYNRSDRGFGVANIERDIVYNCLFCKPEVLIFHFGANDCRFRFEQGRIIQLTPYSEFVRLLKRISQAIAFASCKVVTIGIAPPPAALETRRPGYGREVDRYNDGLKAFSRDCGASFIHIPTLIARRRMEEFLLADGYHFNTKMHQLLGDELLRTTASFRLVG